MFVFEVLLIRIFPHSYSVSLPIQSECGEIGTRKTPNTDTFRAVYMKTIREDLFSKKRLNFRESAVFRYLASTYFRESRN